ncbi:MAG TPA: flagellar basal body L-ring protein FlgH, partial [Armatimonadota bacterium]
MRKLATLLGLSAVGLTVLLGPACRADSLWKPKGGTLFGDVKARGVGDLVTVLISESATAQSKATTDLSKKSTVDVTGGKGLVMGLVPSMSFGGSDSSSAAGTTARSSSLVARMTVKVKAILPNGNLLLEGTHSLTTNKEKEEMVFTGVVRPTDIQPDNTVNSTQVADAQITLNGKGPIGARQKPGIFTKLLH